jgi:hypothetical protein
MFALFFFVVLDCCAKLQESYFIYTNEQAPKSVKVEYAFRIYGKITV